MLYELKAPYNPDLQRLFAPLWYHLAIFSALEGRTPARVVADDPALPSRALLWDKVEGGYYLVGNPDDASFNRDLNRVIREDFTPQAQAEDHSLDLVVNAAPMAWERTMGDVLAGIHFLRAARQHFIWREALDGDSRDRRWRERVPEGMEMLAVDAAFLQRSELDNMEDVTRWVQESWGLEDFLARGIGQCLVHGNTIASWCIGDYATAHTCEIGIHTDDAYRRRGLATLAVSATLEQCLARGYTEVGWHCWSNNSASAATARKAGLRETVEHPVWHAWYNALDNELVQAKAYMDGPMTNPLQPVDYAAAAEAYRRAFALVAADPALAARATVWNRKEWHPYFYRSAALSHLHLGDIHAARRYLEQAVAAGMSPEWGQALLEDEGLRALRDTAAWRDVVAALEPRRP